MTHQYMEIKIKELEKRINALEKEHCEYKPFTIDELEDDDIKKLLRLFQDQKVLDSVIPEQEPCEDAISREAALMELDKYLCGVPFDEKGIDEVIKELPSVTSQPKMGRWIYIQYDGNPRIGNWKCSLCIRNVMFGQNQNDKPLYNYCPHCGARMAESEGEE